MSQILLSTSEHQSLMKAMAESLEDREASVRRAAILSFGERQGRFAEPPVLLKKGLSDELVENRIAALISLNIYSKSLDHWTPLLFRMLEKDGDPEMQQQCMRTLYTSFKPPAITADSIPFLTTSLGSKSVRIRSLAASILGEFGKDATEAVLPLLTVLNEPLDQQVVPSIGPAPSILDPGCAAASSLGRIAPETNKANEVIAELMEVARSGPVSRRGWAAVALGDFGPSAEEAVPVLIQVIKDAAPEGTFERESSAAKALGKIAFDSSSANLAIEALLPLLQSKLELNRQTATEALSRFGTEAGAAIPRLRELKNDHSVEVSNAAKKALMSIENLSER